MKHLFLNEDYSKLLYYLGFNEPCLAYWDKGKLMFLDEKFGMNTNEIWVFNDNSTVTAPTIGQAHDYFEKKFGLYGYVRPSSKTIGEFEFILLSDKGQTLATSITSVESRDNCYKYLLKRMFDEASKIKNKKKELI